MRSSQPGVVFELIQGSIIAFRIALMSEVEHVDIILLVMSLKEVWLLIVRLHVLLASRIGYLEGRKSPGNACTVILARLP